MEHSSQVVQTFIAIMNKSFHIKRIILLLCINYHYQYNMGDAVGAPVNEETVGHLRQRLNVMRDIVKVGQDLLLRIQLKLNTALLSTVRLCVTGVTPHISHIYKGINAMLIIRGPIKPYIF